MNYKFDAKRDVTFSFEVIRQRKLGKTTIEEVHFIGKTIKI